MIESLRLSDILDKSMYRKGFSSSQASNTSIPTDVISAAFKFKRKGRGEYIIPSSQPLDFSKYSTEHLEELWSRFSSSNYDEESLKYTDHNLRFEIMKCFNALEFWWLTPGSKRYSREEIMRSTLLVGPAYAERISDEWDYGIRRSHRIKDMFGDFNEWRPILHYNELPPVGYLIRWKETSDDIKYMQIPLEDFNEDLLGELEDEIMTNLPDELEFPKDIEILAEVKTSTTLDLDRMKSIPFYMGRLSPEGSQFSRIFKAKRSVIPVGPANTRDAVITTIDTYNSVKKCDLIMGRVLDEQESSLVNTSSQVFHKRLKDASRTPNQFGSKMYWLRDIKKCGLTFPRQLIHLIQKCLSEKFPDKDFSCFDIYRNYSIFDEDGKPIKTSRGYCLGMANNCVTFIQCMLYNMLEKRVPWSINLKGYFGNDDSILEVSSGKNESRIIDETDAMMIQIIDFEMLDGLNIMTNGKKSFWSWYPIIFEEYGKPEFKEKDSRVACALSSALLAPDIKYAKLLTSSLSLAFWSEGSWIAKCLDAITSYWGFEYYPEEIKYDYSLGGWISLRSKGCSLALRNVESAPNDLLQIMWGAYKDHRAFKKNVIRPVLKGSVTKNFSVTGSILNITYVDDDLYDIPELPIEMIYLDRKGYIDFYESIYRFNRSPYKVMASRIRSSILRKPKEDIEKRSFMEYMLSDTNVTFAIPEILVRKSTSIFDVCSDGRTDCDSLRRNCLARFIEQLRIDKIITCSEQKIEPSGEYPFVQSYESTPFTDKVNVLISVNGEIDKSIYQFSTNPWLPLSEYVEEYDRLPLVTEQVVEERKHLPIWFMTKHYRNSREISLAYQMMDMGEEFVCDIIDQIRDIEKKETMDESQKEPVSIDLCYTHQAGYSPWSEVDDIYFASGDECILCIMECQLWRARKRSSTAMSVSERLDAYREIAPLRSRITFFIEKHYPLLLSSLPKCLQSDEVGNVFAADIDSDDDMLGFMDFG